jgi:hypothetical protein
LRKIALTLREPYSRAEAVSSPLERVRQFQDRRTTAPSGFAENKELDRPVDCLKRHSGPAAADRAGPRAGLDQPCRLHHILRADGTPPAAERRWHERASPPHGENGSLRCI